MNDKCLVHKYAFHGHKLLKNPDGEYIGNLCQYKKFVAPSENQGDIRYMH